jgi:hypothetical protein
MKRQKTKPQSKTDWKRIDAMQDEDIDFSDASKLGPEFFANATLWSEPSKRTSGTAPRTSAKRQITE